MTQTMSPALRRRETVSGYLFLLPSLVFFVGFVVVPMVMCIVTSFFDANMNANTPDVFIGLANYKELWQDKVFLKALRNTFIMKWMYNNYYGIFNYLLKGAGLISKNINWLGDPKYALGCIIIILLTTSVGQPIVLYVSALSNVDSTLVEAAEVDGATNLQVFWKIKWPQIMPTTLYILVITTINSFQCFALIQLLTSGGPNSADPTMRRKQSCTTSTTQRSSCTASATAMPWAWYWPSLSHCCRRCSSAWRKKAEVTGYDK